ncbi:MAG TPA: hypothetical protein VJM12_16800, partial [Pyrinomonadaceae bacterium]|nr:hypothetical protein [Pyrinomonadaceae bacterium]
DLRPIISSPRIDVLVEPYLQRLPVHLNSFDLLRTPILNKPPSMRRPAQKYTMTFISGGTGILL